MKKRKVALILQGGGAIGAFEYGAIKAIYEDKRFIPDVVTGVSVGAVNAALLIASRNTDPIQALDDFWRQLTTKDLGIFNPLPRQLLTLTGNKKTFRVNWKGLLNPLTLTHLYNPAPLYNLMQKIINIRKLNSSKTSMVITAVNIRTGELTQFCNWGKDKILLEDIIASGAVPIAFPIQKVGTLKPEYYWDGGIVSNTPMAPAINRLEELEPENTQTKRYIITINLFPEKNLKVPSNLLEVANRIIEIAGSNNSAYDLKLANKFNEIVGLFEHLDKNLPPNHPIRQDPRYKKIRRHKIIKPVYIVNTDPMPIGDFLDFSVENTNNLKNAGYIATQNTLANITDDDD